ncbi:hypothetical protein dsmv_1168 [Desulfococcus multivorans DSM 2059]|jgi:hypothetical protein|uniref:Uncharacterized protein n=1 Tax=Desulfococcus multivorans DSM 2059 TaxID=1121405 RepID=S7VH26_DESML|nr:hypothetical protein dsmv_1168 [Desulfococcus multivorans DSM 2059]SJZ55645.1 hypothetical protein SAMN02745446_00945 [Desulfococcus multivorans DSM 2059]
MRYIIILITISFMTFLALELISGPPEVLVEKPALVNQAPPSITVGNDITGNDIK